MYTYHTLGRCVMDNKVMPSFTASSYMTTSVSMETALVHSSSSAYTGLETNGAVHVMKEIRWVLQIFSLVVFCFFRTEIELKIFL